MNHFFFSYEGFVLGDQVSLAKPCSIHEVKSSAYIVLRKFLLNDD